ncbi:hypothetical protein M436DRAFT_68581 [Aureobasidium namibiae CBS 147.97]|uniref:Uncharacterized protein n=1 Tax=Aureobasidium namibiae CBS 147.97 TaxID=1043004 RepID=A0A074WVZ0_9PEZI
MERLPLELKQRICSFLHANPKLFKPIRLVSKDFASAAAPYIIPRIFLFRHPDSCDEVQKIVQHPVFSKYVTTIAVDVSKLKQYVSFERWADDHAEFRFQYPDWCDYRPIDIHYDEDGNPVLTNSFALGIWIRATEEFSQAWKDTIGALEELYSTFYDRQKSFADHVQVDATFEARFWKTVTDAFETCPRLANFIIAPPNIHDPVMRRRDLVFRSCLATPRSFLLPANHIPPEVGLKDILEATKNIRIGLNSLTIVDFPINCVHFSTITSVRSFESLKHIRIGFNRLYDNPYTSFGFSLEGVLHAARLLETLWVETPPRHDNQYDAGGLLRAINSEHFRDILLSNAVVSEDAMVDFLLRHSGSLQQLDLGITINPGTWVPTFQQVAKQMRALKRIQLVGICEIHASEKVIFSTQWCLEAQNFIINGGQLSQPEAYDLDTDFGPDGEEPLRNGDLPENGLWSDYDANANTCF